MKKKQIRLLINTPSLRLLGGVSNHFLGLNDHWSFKIRYCTVGSRNGFNGLLLLPLDLIKFIIKILVYQPDYILLNPSLQLNALKRDALFLKISKILNQKTIVFFHGWDTRVEYMIDIGKFDLLTKFQKADLFLILASNFKNKLREWGFENPIELTTTKVDNELIKDFKVENKVFSKSLLFLARIEKEKGIYIVLDTFKELLKKHKDLSLTIAGDGSELQNVKKFISNHNLKNVIITGRISGKKLKDVFENNCIYFFPTFHGEGMPTSLLEAMAFGLTIVSRPVGGTIDFFNPKMGKLINSKSAEDFSEVINVFLEDVKLLESISNYNYSYASNNFIASIVVKKIENSILNLK